MRLLAGTAHLGLLAASMAASSTAAAQVIASSGAQVENDAEQDGSEVVVTGIRRSLESAIAIKRQASSIVDAISAEDIGRFPDQNLAESLQRVTGVQITRSNGEGSRISVRGLSPDFTRTQYNGRTIATTSGSRSFDFTSLTSDFVNSVEVIKSPTADMIDGGLSATVNVTTARALDVGRDRFAFTAEGIYEDNPRRLTPHVAGYVNKVIGDGVFGFNAGLNFERRRIQTFNYSAFGLENGTEATRNPPLDYNLDGDTRDTFRFNHGAGLAVTDGRTDRFTAIGGLQVRPTETLDLYTDVFYSSFQREADSIGSTLRFTNIAGPGAGVRGSVVEDGVLTFLDADGVDLRNNGRHIVSDNRTFSIALGGKWKLGRLTASAELTHSDAQRLSSDMGLEVLGRASASYDLRDDPGGVPVVEFTRGYDPLNPANFNAVGFNGSYRAPTRDRNRDARLDLSYDADGGFMRRLAVGGIYSDRLNTFRSNSVRLGAAPLAAALGLPFNTGVEGGSFNAAQFMQAFSFPRALDNYDGPGRLPTSFLTSTNDLLFAELPLRDILGLSPPVSDLASDFSVNEKVWAAYVRADFASSDGRLKGNVGVRYVNTRQTSRGYAPDLSELIFTQQGAQTIVPNVSPATVRNDYDNWLPSLNVSFDPDERFSIRFAAARAMTRPDLGRLSTSTSVNANVRTVTQFNPLLRPYLADQLDLSAEYYFSGSGLISAAVFYKDLKNFVVDATRTQDLTLTLAEGGGSIAQPFTFFLPSNGTGGKLKGVEVGAQVPFTFLPSPLDGFGVIANYTYLDVGELKVSEDGPRLPVPGVSKHSYNLAGYYEKAGFGVRLSYNYRSSFVVDSNSFFGDGQYTRAYGQLDASLSYDFNPNLTLNFDVTNLNEAAVRSYDSLGFGRGFEDVGRRFTGGVRVKF